MKKYNKFGMRGLFKELLLKKMEENPDIYLLLGGVGYGVFEPDNKRIINCEASEQAMVDIAVGLAMSGKIPFVYAITPHLYRAYEGLRLYLHYYKIPVKIVGVGRNKDYDILGYTHWAEDDEKIFKTLGGIARYRPEFESNISIMLEIMLINKVPSYINLPR